MYTYILSWLYHNIKLERNELSCLLFHRLTISRGDWEETRRLVHDIPLTVCLKARDMKMCGFLKVQLCLCIYLFLYLSIYILSYHFSALNIFQGFSLNFARTLGRAVGKLLLNGSRVNSHEQFIFGKQSLSLFRGNTAFQQNRRCNFSHFLDMVKTGLFFTSFFFRKIELLIMKMAS